MNVKPLQKNFTIYQGTTFISTFTWDIVNYKLTDKCVVDMEIRETITSSEVISFISTENNKIKILPDLNRIELKISAEETAEFNFTKAVYDIELQFENGDKFRIVQGTLTLNPEVTRVNRV